MKFARVPASARIASLALAALCGASPLHAAPKITAVTADVPVFDDNWIVGDTPLGKIDITFDEAVVVPDGAIFAYTIDAASRAVTVAPLDAASTTVSVTFTTPVAANLVTVVIADGLVKSDSDNSILDGETGDPRAPTFPSGNGQTGGSTVLRYSVLQGDANRDGLVNVQDILFIGPLFGLCDGDVGYDRQADLDDNGCIENVDSNAFGDFFIWDSAPDGNITTALDSDGDGAGDSFDNCVNDANPDQDNPDGDTPGSACEDCPDDANKTVPGVCGCGTPDTSGDGDSVLDCLDNCPDDANENQADADSDDVGDVCDVCAGFDDNDDADNDLIAAGCDNCPDVSNITQIDTDTDGIGNACDNCPAIANADQADADTDGFGDVCDNCPDFVNPNQGADDCIPDEDGDGVVDADDDCPDSPSGVNVDSTGCTVVQRALLDDDDDGVPNGIDVCPNTAGGASIDEAGCSVDQLGDPTPTPTPTPEPTDTTSEDLDGDHVKNEFDLCPDTPPGTAVDATGCPLGSGTTPGTQPTPDDENACGEGIGCGVIGMANLYAVLLGLGWLRHDRRRCA